MNGLLFRRIYEFPIFTETYLIKDVHAIIKIDPTERIRQNKKTTTLRSYILTKPVYKIQYDYSPTYCEDFLISVSNRKRVIFGELTRSQIINDLGLLDFEIKQIEEFTTLEDFFYKGYYFNFPTSKIGYGDLCYLYKITPIIYHNSTQKRLFDFGTS